MKNTKLDKVILKIQNLMPKESYLVLKESDDVFSNFEYYDGVNLCGKFYMTIYPGEKKYELQVSSIRYHSSEKKCKLTGTEILKWLKKVKDEKIVKRIAKKNRKIYENFVRKMFAIFFFEQFYGKKNRWSGPKLT